MTASMGSASTVTAADADVVRAVFQAFAGVGLAALGGLLHADATWYHRNDDRLGGVCHGSDAIMAYLAESAQLTGGTLRAVPQSFMTGRQGRVCMLARLSASRPDGRSMDDPQLVLFTLDDGCVRSIDQFAGDPTAVAAFWA
jgi:ketosteroid isomerase-like protein